VNSLSEILEQAKQVAVANGLPYAGAVTPQQAWEIMQKAPSAKLVDVRSSQELELVGRIPGAIHIEWSYFPDWKPNPDFLAHLKMQVDSESLVMFICRTGGRSHNAAAAAQQAGYAESFNVLQGFEGESNREKQRGKINGWKAAGLPWNN
jgi:rhodanese-related sulfurtransferase